MSIPTRNHHGQADPDGVPHLEQHPRARQKRSASPLPARRLPVDGREKEIVLTKVPGVTDDLADQIARIVRIRQLKT
ncbi:MAG: hypothetical protein R2713_02335 [Ilumatobacteraceae bacterium]